MKTIEKDGSVCHHCGKEVARNRNLNSGKRRVRHKCPHGRWCDAAHPLKATNNIAGCPDCRKWQKERDETRKRDSK